MYSCRIIDQTLLFSVSKALKNHIQDAAVVARHPARHAFRRVPTYYSIIVFRFSQSGFLYDHATEAHPSDASVCQTEKKQSAKFFWYKTHGKSKSV
jgi:hypothetical protein